MKYILFVTTILAMSACGNVNFDPPSGFVEKFKSDNSLVVVSADASRIRVTYKENKKNGTAEFWGELLKRELTKFKAYKMLKSDSYKSKGIVMEFEPPEMYKGFVYTVAVLANDDDVYVIELGCDKKSCADKRKAFDKLVKKVYNKKIK